MKLNKRLLRKVRNRIAEIPESYDQGHFCKPSDKSPCGTKACLAGEIIIMSAPTVEMGVKSLQALMRRFRPSDTASGTNIAKRAAKLIGRTPDDADSMFEGYPEYSWPAPFGKRYDRVSSPRARAKVAVAYLDECLKRGKVTW